MFNVQQTLGSNNKHGNELKWQLSDIHCAIFA